MSDLPLKQVDHPAHNMPEPMFTNREKGLLQLKNAMIQPGEDDNYNADMYNTMRADPIANPSK